ncbi:tyrosine-type recombinase/integrase [Streptomyces sp. NPDC005070]
MARQLVRGMGSFAKNCDCVRPARCPYPYTIRFRNGLGRRSEEGGFESQDAAIERPTQIYAEKKRTAPSVAEARRELGQKTVVEYAKQWRPRQRKLTDYSTGEHVDSSINVHIIPRVGSRKLNTVTPIVVERFLDELEADGVGRGNQVNIFAP